MLRNINVLAGLFAVLFSSASVAESQSYPVTLENCGRSEIFTAPPAHVVTIGQHETELMLALGLEKQVVGTSVWFGKLPDNLLSAGSHLKRLADNSPSCEAVVAQKPDLVLAQYSWHVGPQGEVATRDQCEQLGIKTWISPADCVGKSVTDSSNGDGARSEPYSIDFIKREIDELSKIFNVPVRGHDLNQALSARIQNAQTTMKKSLNTSHPLKVVYWFSSSRLKGDPWIAGSDGAPGWISKTLGLTNIIDSHEEWPAVTWEHIASLKPDVIVIASMERRLYPADSAEVKENFLHEDPVTREIPAVKNNRIIVVPAMSLNPSLRNVDAVELISAKIADFNKSL